MIPKCYTANRDVYDWATPIALYRDLDAEFHFTLDPCASEQNHKCEKYYTKADDGLTKDWSGETVFMNPPYAREIYKWVEKAYNTHTHTIVALLPARTDTKWFHDFIYGRAEIRFIRGRLHYNESKQPAPWGSMIVIWRNNEP